jgi:hypothetical protein
LVVSAGAFRIINLESRARSVLKVKSSFLVQLAHSTVTKARDNMIRFIIF